MNTNERKPLLSDEQVMDARSWPPEQVRDFYESLITTGKLRVVEEVEPVYLYDGDSAKYCHKCGYVVTDINDFPRLFPYCPGCGSKIKR